MLTGDKVETAINIGIATSQLDVEGLQFVYQWDFLEERMSAASTVGTSPNTSPNSMSHQSKAELLASQ